MDTETLKKRIAEINFWYHRIELPGGIVTSGMNPLHTPTFRVPADLTGKRVLDVGAWDGFWTFEALKRGAKEAVAIDDFSDFLGTLKPEERHAWKSFDLCREALGYSEERCKRIEISLYDITPEKLGGKFDMVFCFGTLYHLRHPLLGLDRLSEVSNPGAQLIVESQICDDFSPYRGFGMGYPKEHMVAEFFPSKELAGNETNWWAPSLKCLGGLTLAAGFNQNLTTWKMYEMPRLIGHCRGFASGFKPK